MTLDLKNLKFFEFLNYFKYLVLIKENLLLFKLKCFV